MKKYGCILFLVSFLILFISNFLWLFVSHKGGVYYEVEKDSTTVNEILCNLTKERYDKLLKKGRLDTDEIFAWNPQMGENVFFMPINGKDLCCVCNVKKYLNCKDKSMVTLCSCDYIDIQRSWLCNKLSDGYGEHDYIAWQSFEREILDASGLKYEKDWCDLIGRWYANWFFKNQLYFIAFVLILYFIPCIYILLKKLYKNIFAK